jgi:5-methylcytosine-specific restriction endonuclease McrA
MMMYREQLLDPRWQKKKLKVLSRDRWCCRSCRSKTKTLHAHHLLYFSFLMAWEYPMDLLITLCMDCHEKEKNRPELEKNLASALLVSGFLVSDLLCLGTLIHDKKFSKNLLKKLRKTQNG